MAYIIGQYNHNTASLDDSSFLDPITTGTVKRRQSAVDTGVSGGTLSPFEDECITGLTLTASEYYYFTCQIKRMVNTQTFTVKLVNYDDYEQSGAVEQFIKKIIVQGGDREEWVNLELIFHPVIQFDTILFQLQRTIDDYREMIRYPKIAYQQLGTINDVIENKIGDDITLLKIGVQSHPGLTMCINGEEIHISRAGIFEVKNGVVSVNFFSVTNPATENNTDETDVSSVVGWKKDLNDRIEAIEESTMTTEEKEAAYKAIDSKCFFDTDKTYTIDAFTLDYMYSDT